MTQFKCMICGRVGDLDMAINSPEFGLICAPCDLLRTKVPPSENTCVCCGEVIPEGRQVCLRCGKVLEEPLEKLADEYDKLGESYIVSSKELKDALAFNKKKDSPVDIHKIIDDAMEKRDRTVSIYIGEAGVSVTVSPVDQDKVKWIYREDEYEYKYRFECSNCGMTSEFHTAYCSSCGEQMHGVKRMEECETEPLRGKFD